MTRGANRKHALNRQATTRNREDELPRPILSLTQSFFLFQEGVSKGANRRCTHLSGGSPFKPSGLTMTFNTALTFKRENQPVYWTVMLIPSWDLPPCQLPLLHILWQSVDFDCGSLWYGSESINEFISKTSQFLRLTFHSQFFALSQIISSRII